MIVIPSRKSASLTVGLINNGSPQRARRRILRVRRLSVTRSLAWIALAFGGSLIISGSVGLSPNDESKQLATQAIEIIRVGQRVIADDPHQDVSEETQVDEATYRLLTLRAVDHWEDGTVDTFEIQTLQPPEWIAKHSAQPGATVPIPLDLQDMGVESDLMCTVVSIAPCPSIAPPPGRVVLTTVSHLNSDVRELAVRRTDGSTTTIRITGTHKLFSETAQDWTSASDLEQNDVVQSLHGGATVVHNRTINGTHRVYNMTVEGEHVYHVSPAMLLAHNNNCIERLREKVKSFEDRILDKKRPGYTGKQLYSYLEKKLKLEFAKDARAEVMRLKTQGKSKALEEAKQALEREILEEKASIAKWYTKARNSSKNEFALFSTDDVKKLDASKQATFRLTKDEKYYESANMAYLKGAHDSGKNIRLISERNSQTLTRGDVERVYKKEIRYAQKLGYNLRRDKHGGYSLFHRRSDLRQAIYHLK